jgi:hypothetical protein
MLILTYFYGKFTAKNWKFTTKLDFFRKKTIPNPSGSLRALTHVRPTPLASGITDDFAPNVAYEGTEARTHAMQNQL